MSVGPIHLLMFSSKPIFRFDNFVPALPTLCMFTRTSGFRSKLRQGANINRIIIKPCSAFREIPLGRSVIQLDIVRSTQHPSQGLLDIFHPLFCTLLDQVVVN